MYKSEQVNELAAALSKAQGVMKPAIFDKSNPHFKSKYATLASIWDAIRKPLADNGLSVTQTTRMNGVGIILDTQLMHVSGQLISSEYPLVAGAPQAMGSSMTYARRYCLSAICGITADDDDDANEAQKATPRANPHVTTAEDINDHKVDYDQDGHPIENIPRGEDGIERLSKAMARPEYANLTADIKNAKALGDLEKWGRQNRNRVESLPLDWQEMLRGEYRTQQIALGWQPKETGL